MGGLAPRGLIGGVCCRSDGAFLDRVQIGGGQELFGHLGRIWLGGARKGKKIGQ